MTDRQILEAVLAEVKGLVTRMDRMEEHQERFGITLQILDDI